LYDCPTGPRLCDGLRRWNGLSALASGDRDATRHYRGGGYAETCACDEIAARDHRSSAFTTLSGF
jgi:hypothetical protein